MSAGLNEIGREMLFGCLGTAFNVMKIVVPLMIAVELLMAYRVIEKLAVRLEGLGKIMGMSRDAVFPLLVGVLMGVTYGAGTIMEINRRTPLSRKDMALIAVFMYLCHGIVESGFLFYAAGANGAVVSLGRLSLAFLVTAAAARSPFFLRMETDPAGGPRRDGGTGNGERGGTDPGS